MGQSQQDNSSLSVARRPFLDMGILAGPRASGQRPGRDTKFYAEVFLYSFANGPADDDGTSPGDSTPPKETQAQMVWL